MKLRSFMEEAFQRGERIKEQILVELLHSPAVQELLQSDVVLKALTRMITTKYELKKLLMAYLNQVRQQLNLSSREDFVIMERKIHRLEQEIDALLLEQSRLTAKPSETPKVRPAQTPKKREASAAAAKPKKTSARGRKR